MLDILCIRVSFITRQNRKSMVMSGKNKTTASDDERTMKKWMFLENKDSPLTQFDSGLFFTANPPTIANMCFRPFSQFFSEGSLIFATNTLYYYNRLEFLGQYIETQIDPSDYLFRRIEG